MGNVTTTTSMPTMFDTLQPQCCNEPLSAKSPFSHQRARDFNQPEGLPGGYQMDKCAPSGIHYQRRAEMSSQHSAVRTCLPSRTSRATVVSFTILPGPFPYQFALLRARRTCRETRYCYLH